MKQYRKEGSELKEAIDLAIRRCIDEGILDDFLKENSTEVMRMLFNEITSEEFAEIRAKEAAKEAAKEYYGKGVEEGVNQGRSEGLEAGLEKGAAGLIDICQELGLSREDARKKLEDKLSLSEEAAEAYMGKFWK